MTQPNRRRAKKAAKFLVIGLLLLALGPLVLRLGYPLPSLEARSISTAFSDTGETSLGRAIAPQVHGHPAISGVYPLANAHHAFAARMQLIKTAERSLDLQYYIWNGDRTGTLMFEAVHQAARRGVRVRLLLDDNPTAGLDPTLAALGAHPNIEVRLFNPFVYRNWRLVDWAIDFSRLNRRMHNKSFTADNQATIIGGRNIGDEYFDAAAAGALTFSDLDVLAVGPVVNKVSRDFDRYWASESSYPVELMMPPAEPGALEGLSARAAAIFQHPGAQGWLENVAETPIVERLMSANLDLEWAPTRMVSDSPAKGLGQAGADGMLTRQLIDFMGPPNTELDLVSAYFVPGSNGTRTFRELTERGVRVRILANSLEATDVPPVHSGYIKRRKALLKAGVELYEMRLVPAAVDEDRNAGIFGSSATSLHAKTFAIDREQIFIGSFNFDPRSARLNTELGFVIESANLSQRLGLIFDDGVPTLAYQVHLDEDKHLYWTIFQDGELVRFDTEPGTSVWQRTAVKVMSWLPIDWLL